jgi:3-methylfumaryl-CoA hydratase
MNISGWTPHTVIDDVVVAPEPVIALQALLDDGLPQVATGDPLPPLWHWVALPRWASSGELGVDGHPRRGSFLPPVEQPRRMFAGGRVTFSSPLVIGSSVRREAAVTNVVEKQGRSGRLTIVDVTSRFYADDVLALEEEQNLVYRDAAQSQPDEAASPSAMTAAQATVGPPLSRTGSWEWSLATDPTLLMRFSAATANTHRIHYDWPYATRVEGYPGLVVHGPMMSIVLAEVARLEGVADVTQIVHRNSAPLFCGMPATISTIGTNGSDDGTTLQLASEGAARTTLTFWTRAETSG